MVLDLDSFRDDKGGNLAKIRVNQEKRFKDLKLVETVVSKGIFFDFHNFPRQFVIKIRLYLFKTLNGVPVASKPTTSTSSRMFAARRSASE